MFSLISSCSVCLLFLPIRVDGGHIYHTSRFSAAFKKCLNFLCHRNDNDDTDSEFSHSMKMSLSRSSENLQTGIDIALGNVPSMVRNGHQQEARPHLDSPSGPHVGHGGHGQHGHKRNGTELSHLLEAQEKEELEEHHIAELRRQQLPWYQRLCDYCCECIASLLHSKKDSLDSIFWLNRPWIFFITVEFTFLVECFYISLYMTQLLPIATRTEYV